MKKLVIYALAALTFVIYSCGDNDDDQPAPANVSSDYRDFTNTTDFLNVLSEVSGSGDIDRILGFLDSLKSNNKAPYVKDDTAIFIYYGDVSSVNWAGDFNGWNANDN